jgi:DMSO reductase anchor subunit
MNIRDIALVTFSILAQISVGSFLTLGGVHWYAQRKAGIDQADKFGSASALWG